MFNVMVSVSYKASVLDPQAEVIEGAIHRLGYPMVSDFKLGKTFEFQIKSNHQKEAEEQVIAICEQLLANTNMEAYEFAITEAN